MLPLHIARGEGRGESDAERVNPIREKTQPLRLHEMFRHGRCLIRMTFSIHRTLLSIRNLF